jgi:hypothetical protein
MKVWPERQSVNSIETCARLQPPADANGSDMDWRFNHSRSLQNVHKINVRNTAPAT